MPVIATADAVRATRRRASSNGTGFWLTTYIGANRYAPGAVPPPGPDEPYPMAFLVEQDAAAVVGAHYHQADQFQVVVGGEGRLGRHDIAQGALHFAGAWSAYGPLQAGPEGLSYFTLRNGWDPGARYMEFPDNRVVLRGLRRQHREVVGDIAPTADGLLSRRYRLAPGEAVTGPDPARGAGQFWLVLAGCMRIGACGLAARSCVFVGAAEAAFSATAADGGAELLLMQFPQRTTAAA